MSQPSVSSTNVTDPKQQRSKKSLLIRAGFQGQIIFFVVLAGIACIAANGYLYYSYVVGSYDFILGHSRLPQELIDQRYRDLFTLWLSLTVLNFLIILAVAIWALIVTHRAAGAIYHIRRVAEAIKAGNVAERVHLREKDEFQDLARSFNEMMDELQKIKPGA
jgi:HAMP domain-containing protein